ncbi:MAG: hypothetical protein ACRC1H_15230, partial [Caldilineaceae bacterium]
RLSILRGRFSRQAAEAVAGASLRMLLALSHKSLVYRDSSAAAAATGAAATGAAANGSAGNGAEGERYVLHELLRQYAVERLGERPELYNATRNQLSAWAASRLRALKAQMQGPAQRVAFDAVAAELPGLREGLRWAVQEGRTHEALPMINALLVYYSTRTWRQEAIGLLSELEALAEQQGRHLHGSPDDVALWTALHIAHAFFSDFNWASADAQPDWFAFVRYFSLTESRPRAEAALAMIQTPEVREPMGLSLVALGQIVYFMGRQEEGLPLLREGVERLRRRGEQGDLALALTWLASACSAGLLLDEADTLADEAIVLCKGLGDRLQYARLLVLKGTIAGTRTSEVRPTRARDLREAMAIFLEMGALSEAAFAMGTLADEYDSAGDYAAAVRYNAEARAMVAPLNDRDMMHNTLSWEALAATRLGHYRHARSCRQQSLDLSLASNDPFLTAWNHWELGEIARLAGDLDACALHWREAERLFGERNILNGLVFLHRGYAELALRRGDVVTAQAQYAESLACALEDGHRWSECYAHAGLGRVALLAADAAAARGHLMAALQQAVELNNLSLICICMQGMAGLALLEGDLEQAVEWGALVIAQPSTWHEFRAQAVALLAAGLSLLPADVGES